MSQTVGDFVVNRLHEWGVTRVYGYPGDGINGIFGALNRSKDRVRFIQARHEEMAAFMACAHAKFTGEVGVCMATSGPGAIHLLNGLYDAELDGMPVVAIVGQQATTAIGSDYQQEVDLISLFKDVAGDYVHMCHSPAQARTLVDQAVRIAKADRTVTCIIFPNDLQEAEMQDPPLKHGATFSGVGYSSPRIIPKDEDLRRAAENGDRLFVYAERRMGKTSLVKQVLAGLDPKRFLPVYVDLWPTDGVESFVTVVAKALAEASETRLEKILEASKELFTRFQPSLTLDEAGNPSLQLGVRSSEARGPALEEVLAAPPKVAARRGRRVVMVLDEFQQVLEYDDDHAERALRAAVQQHDGVAYLFLGSRKHLIERMFADNRRPLYRAAGHYPLQAIATEHWVPFIGERFVAAEKTINDAQIEELCELTDGHPFYTQHFAHALWERTPRGQTVTEEALNEALEVLLQREGYAFATRWETLTKNQQRFLRGVAAEPSPGERTAGAQPFSAQVVQAYGLGTPSNAQRAAESLLNLNLIDREDGVFVITDRFFKLWIRRM